MSIIKYNVTRKAPIANTENHAMPVITYDNLIEAQETHVERALVRNAMIEGDRVDARVFGYFARIHASDLRHFGYKGCDLWDFVLDESEYPLDDLVYDADLDDPNPGRTIDDMFRQYGPDWASEAGEPVGCEDTHKPICKEYWDRGLECRCIPESVKDAIRAGADPSDVM